MPRLSIIIPCYNDGRFLDEAVNSALETDWDDVEILVVSDGSTDAYTLERLKFWEQSTQVKVIRQKNSGLASARNMGIKNSTGTYILPLDADNHLRSEYGREGVQFLEENQDYSVFYSDVVHFGDVNKEYRVFDFSLQRLLMYNFVDACAVYRRSVWEAVGGYDEKMPAMGIEDWDFWIRVAIGGNRFHHENAFLYEYRVRADSMINQETAPKMKMLMDYMAAKYPGILEPKFASEYIHWRFQQKGWIFLLKLLWKRLLPSHYQNQILNAKMSDI